MSDMRMKLPEPNPELAKLLEQAKARGPMTADELFEQSVSWVYGEMALAGSDVTKDQVRKYLEAKR